MDLRDLDGDGDLDLFATRQTLGSAVILENSGNGAFLEARNLLLISRPSFEMAKSRHVLLGLPEQRGLPIYEDSRRRNFTFIRIDDVHEFPNSDALIDFFPGGLITSFVMALAGRNKLVSVFAHDAVFPKIVRTPLEGRPAAMVLGELDGGTGPSRERGHPSIAMTPSTSTTMVCSTSPTPSPSSAGCSEARVSRRLPCSTARSIRRGTISSALPRIVRGNRKSSGDGPKG